MANKAAPKQTWESESGQAENRYLRHNMFGEGKDSGVGTDSRRWRGTVAFYNGYAQIRYMGYHRNASWPNARRHVFIHKHKRPNLDWHWVKEYEGDAVFLRVPDLAVFSKYPGDQLDETGTHDRVKLIMLHEIREFVLEEVPAISAPQLTMDHISVGDFDFRVQHGQKAWAGYEQKPLSEWLQDKYDDLIDRWVQYNHAFDLRWKPVPAMYEEEMHRIIKGKLRKYQDPKAVERRERARARKIAMDALSINAKPVKAA